jgi:ABC-type siderophore export system fused ATPase/permease subunit
MKEQGKIVIAITHDDNYFDAADKIIKMDVGKIEFIENGEYHKLLEPSLVFKKAGAETSVLQRKEIKLNGEIL